MAGRLVQGSFVSLTGDRAVMVCGAIFSLVASRSDSIRVLFIAHYRNVIPLRGITPATDAEWSKALIERDTEGVLPYMDEDYTLVVLNPALARVARREWLAMLPQYVISEWITEFSEWDVADDLAVHTHVVHQLAVVMGADRSGPFTITDVWRRSDDGWKIWRRVSTPLTTGDMPRMT